MKWSFIINVWFLIMDVYAYIFCSVCFWILLLWKNFFFWKMLSNFICDMAHDMVNNMEWIHAMYTTKLACGTRPSGCVTIWNHVNCHIIFFIMIIFGSEFPLPPGSIENTSFLLISGLIIGIDYIFVILLL